MAGRPLQAALLTAVAVLAAAERELRFKAPPPAETPVRLFTEPELARYDGQQVGPRGREGGREGGRGCPAAGPRRDGRCAARRWLQGCGAAGLGCLFPCTAWACRSSALSPGDVRSLRALLPNEVIELQVRETFRIIR